MNLALLARLIPPDHTERMMMENMKLGDISDAVSSMQTLRESLTAELDQIEDRIHELEEWPLATTTNVISDLRVYHVTRAALYSGLASINEVLGWVRMMAVTDAEGNTADAVKSLPIVPVFSLH